MKELLEYLIKNIVDQQDDVEISEETDETGTVIFKVKVSPADVGKVIGKKGKIINSVRNIVRIKAIKTNQRARVEVVNPPQEETKAPAEQVQEKTEPAAPVESQTQEPVKNQPQAPVVESQAEKPAKTEEVVLKQSEATKTEVPTDAGLDRMPTKQEPAGKQKTVEELTQPQE